MKHLSLILLTVLAGLSGCQQALYTHQQRPKMLYEEGIARHQPSPEKQVAVAPPAEVMLADAGEGLAAVATPSTSTNESVATEGLVVESREVVKAHTVKSDAQAESGRRISLGERLAAKRIKKLMHHSSADEKGKAPLGAILATVFGVLGAAAIPFGIPTLAVLLGVVAIIMGTISLGKIRRQNRSGRGWGIAGIVLGSLSVLVLVLAIVALMTGGFGG